MGSRTALVLAGGGAKGAFQVGAERYLRERAGFTWDIVSGVSVGALNGALIAQGDFAELDAIWKNLRDGKAIMKKGIWRTLWRMVMKRRSIWSHSPLWDLIQENVHPDYMDAVFTCTATSLQSGKAPRVTVIPGETGPVSDVIVQKAVLSSATLPGLWEPQTFGEGYEDLVDGGVREQAPIGAALDHNPDEVVVITNSPRNVEHFESVSSITDVLKRTLEIGMNEIFRGDLNRFLEINGLVQDAAREGLHLLKGEKALKHYPTLVVEPKTYLGDALDFSDEAVERRIEAGWQAAQEAVEDNIALAA